MSTIDGLATVCCPKCGSDEHFDSVSRWGRISYYDFQCCCGCEWEGGFTMQGEYFEDKNEAARLS